MIKAELISKLAEKTGWKKVDCEKFYSALAEVALEGFKSKKNLPLGTLGQLKYRLTKERVCKSIRTGEMIQIPEKGSVVFSASKYLKESLAKVV